MTEPHSALPLVSVVIPAYKARNYLRESLASVAAQDYPNLEILVVDDCSPEPIDDIIESYQVNQDSLSLRVIRHDKNQGQGAGRNSGIMHAMGEYIALLDHDDIWAVGHLRTLMIALQDTNADLSYCSVIQFHDQPDKPRGTWGPKPEDLAGNFHLSLFTKSFITPSATLIKRSVFSVLGGFDPSPRLHACEDIDFWLRMLKHGFIFAYSDKPTCYYRKHESAVTSQSGYMAIQSAYVRQLHANDVPARWLTKRSLVAAGWWKAWVTLLNEGRSRWDILARALWLSLPVPWEIARGLLRALRRSHKR